MEVTPNYELKKPGDDDFYDVKDFNDNVDIIDQALKAHDDALATKETPQGAQEKADAALNSAKQYTDQEVGEVAQALTTHLADEAAHGIGNKATLLTTQKGSIVGAINELFTNVSSGKNSIATAITGMGQSASGSDTFTTLANKIKDISKDAIAQVEYVLTGQTFYQGGLKRIGTMPDRGAINSTITTQGGSVPISTGYHNGAGKVTASFPNLVASNIKAGVNVGGVVGTFDGGNIYVNKYDETWAWNAYGVNSYPEFNVIQKELFLRATIRGTTQSGNPDEYTFTVTVRNQNYKTYVLYESATATPVQGAYSVTVDLEPKVLVPGDKIFVQTSGTSYSDAPNWSTGYAFTVAEFPESLEPYFFPAF